MHMFAALRYPSIRYTDWYTTVTATDLHGRGHYEMTAGVCLSVRLSAWRMLRLNARTARPWSPKLNLFIQVKSSKSQGHHAD